MKYLVRWRYSEGKLIVLVNAVKEDDVVCEKTVVLNEDKALSDSMTNFDGVVVFCSPFPHRAFPIPRRVLAYVTFVNCRNLQFDIRDLVLKKRCSTMLRRGICLDFFSHVRR